MAKKENTQSCFQRGLISLLILALLDQEDMYGYQIVQEITERSGGAIVTEEGSLYPVLYKLQDQGMLSGEKVLVGKRLYFPACASLSLEIAYCMRTFFAIYQLARQHSSPSFLECLCGNPILPKAAKPCPLLMLFQFGTVYCTLLAKSSRRRVALGCSF